MRGFRRRLLTVSQESGIPAGTVMNFEYTGVKQEIELPKGDYKLECWGAQGGYRSSSTYGGKGGYSTGIIHLNAKTKLYVYTGGSGNTGGTNGGFNGGGKRATFNGGGGASDIRIGTDSLYARVIVAGGGGSDGASAKTGMYGGGTSGGSTTQSFGSGGFGGTQTGVSDSLWQTTSQSPSTSSKSDAYAGFGFGGNGVFFRNGYGGAGGGGWYGGSGAYPDGSGDDDRGGGGGSGYVYTSKTASSYPSGCLLNYSHYLTNASTVAGNLSFTNPTGSAETGHSGNGYVRITSMGKNNDPLYAYTPLNYIESNGDAYIDTGVSANPNLRVWADFEFTSTATRQQRIFGRTTNGSGFCFDFYINGSGFLAWACQDIDGNWQSTNVYATTTRNTIDLDSYNNTVKINDGATYSVSITTTRTINDSRTIYLMQTNFGSIGIDTRQDRWARARLHACKIYNQGVLIRDYIPVQRNSDGVCGLFDIVDNTFYPSLSATGFTGA